MLYRPCPWKAQSPTNAKQWFWAVAKHMLKSCQKTVPAKKEPAQEETPNYEVILLRLGFFLGRLPFGGDHFLTTLVEYVLRRQNNDITLLGIFETLAS